MELTIGSTTRPHNALSFAAACERIACAGYTDVAVFAHDRVMPARRQTPPKRQAARIQSRTVDQVGVGFIGGQLGGQQVAAAQTRAGSVPLNSGGMRAWPRGISIGQRRFDYNASGY